jgi:hypothetical protein
VSWTLIGNTMKENRTGFFHNRNLDNVTARPGSFPSKDSWNKLNSKERIHKWEKGFSSKQE